ncbi:MAG: histidine--tRNA ligase [Deltaproteobacteria bacterium]|jgi:histidyl-tRNA synthetase|nr:histidine--tRNA ligase [Deltaproteobacteria bacterium]
MTSLTAIRGFKDILPTEATLWRLVEEKAREVVGRFDFAELRPPIMERTELFQRSIGQTTDIVEKEMYTMADRSGEMLTLRPEATAGLVRALIEHNLSEGGRATKLFCLGPMFRYERPQKGRLRQFNQLDVEIFSDPGPYSDAEIIHLLHTFLDELGLPNLSVVINSLGCPQCRPLYRSSLTSYLSGKKEQLCDDCRRRLEHNPLRILDCKSDSCQAQVKEAPTFSDYWCPECRSHFQTVKDSLTSLSLPYFEDVKLVRGLDYYTRTTFEVRSGDLGAQSAVAGGGRYDGLCQELGGPDIPAIGFAAGLERLILLLSERAQPGPSGPDYYVAVLSPEALGPAFVLVQALRCRGKRVAADWESGGLKSRLKRADKALAAKVIMIGPDELASGLVTVRDLNSKEQTKLELNKPELF